jgi:hypothetical protein
MCSVTEESHPAPNQALGYRIVEVGDDQSVLVGTLDEFGDRIMPVSELIA